MMIIPIQTEPDIILELHFTVEEKEHPLFQSVSSDISELKSVDVTPTQKETLEILKEDKPETVEYYIKTVSYPVNPKEDINLQLGRLVDMVREKYCGDVVSPEIQSIDTKTKEPIYETKDYTGIPQFTIGKIREITEVTKTIDPIKKKLN